MATDAIDIVISRRVARKLALRAQFLAGSTHLPKGKEGAARIIEELGYVQIDTIAVIERAHHHTLWTRRPDYNPRMLHELQAVDRRVFEYWGHVASYLPMSDYRFYQPYMRTFREPDGGWQKRLNDAYGHLTDSLLRKIRDTGPATAQELAPDDQKRTGAWWGWKPTKGALELLFSRGDLMISERRNFHRVYDLRERVLPAETRTIMPDDDELGRFFVRRALRSYGLALEKDIRGHLPVTSKEVFATTLRNMLEEGEIVPVKVSGDSRTVYFASAESLGQLPSASSASNRLYLLSPFDNLIIQRERLRKLFDFDYTLECYVPARKRKYGYFSLPILWRDEFVGRLDPKAERKNETLTIRFLSIESEVTYADEFAKALSRQIAELARFNQCTTVIVEKTSPARWKRTVQSALRAETG